MATQTTAPQIPWRDPSDAALTWIRDAMHFPAPATPLTDSVLSAMWDPTLSRVAQELLMPARMRLLCVDGHVYNGMDPMVPGPEMPARVAAHEQEMMARAVDLRRRWDAEYLPEVEAANAEMDALQFAPGSGDADIERMLELWGVVWRIHFLTVFPRMMSGEVFAGMYGQVVPEAEEMEPYKVLAGEPTKNLESDRALWALAQAARGEPAVAEALAAPNTTEALARLETTDAGRAWRAEFDAFLVEYGNRSNALDLSSPTWREDPAFALENLRRFLEADATDPEGSREALVAERERLEAIARERLAGDPAALAAFDGILTAARANWPLEEDHNFHIDQRGIAAGRRAALRLGERLVDAGAIDDPADVVWLTLEEVRLGLGAGGNLRGTVSAARRRNADQALVEPAPFIGSPPDPNQPPPPGFEKFFGKVGPPQVEGTVLRGSPGSGGRAEGVARVVAHVSELSRVNAGEIMVCRSTTPPWTPIFGSIAALVTDTGGVLAHGAIVAREYGIPAVMGTKIGTRMIPDGARIRVDGDAGEVTLLQG